MIVDDGLAGNDAGGVTGASEVQNLTRRTLGIARDACRTGFQDAEICGCELEAIVQGQHDPRLTCYSCGAEQRREAVVPIHYRGFEIPNKFVFGFGLDLDEYYRNLPFVGVVDLEKYKPSS